MPSTAKSAGKIMAAIFGSRILGLVREVVLSSIFGASLQLDALKVAFRIPNLLRDLFAEGALSTAFVTVFSKKLQTEGKPQAFLLANLVLTTLAATLAVITLLGILASPWIVSLLAHEFQDEPGKFELTVRLTQLMFPFIFFVSLAAFYMGLLNSLGSFGLPASASTVFNIVSILAGLALGYLFDPTFGTPSIYGFAIGVLLGGIAQLLIQVPKAIQLGYLPKPAWNLRDEGLRKVMILMAPAIIGGAAVQVNVMVNTRFAAGLGNGAVTCLDNAFRLMQLPIGLFGVAVATVTLPSISRSAAALDIPAFRAKIQEGLQLAFFLCLPASIGCAILAAPLVRLIFQHGTYTADAAAQTTVILQAFCLGLAGYSGIKVLAPAFYALDLAKIPLRVSLMGILLNLGLNFFFIRVINLGLVGLPLSTSLVALLNFTQLSFALRKQLKGLGDKNFLPNLLKISASSALMAALLLIIVEIAPFPSGFLPASAFLAVLISFGALIYFGTCYLLEIPELLVVVQSLQRRLGSK